MNTSTSKTTLEILRTNILKKRSELNSLESELMNLEEGEMSRHTKVGYMDMHRDEKISFVLLITTCICMGIFVLSGWFMNPDQTRNSKPWIQLAWPGSAKKACSVNDGNYTDCVEGQKQGSGCVWYASCNKCVSQNTQDISSVCK